MNRLINIVDAIAFPHQIILLNANPDLDLTEYISRENKNKVDIINSPVRRYMLYRYGIAFESGYSNFLLVDDDLFYSTKQINKLIKFYLKEPHLIHGGGFGQKIIYKNEMPELETCMPYCDGFFDVIGRIYCFGRQHIDNLKHLLDRLKIDFDYPRPGCDILLSFSGRPNKPKCHNLGRYANCPTSAQADIAICKTDNFHNCRNKLIRQILSVAFP